MLKNLLMFLVLGMVAAMPATAMASNNWDGGGVDKFDQGPGTAWTDPVNWAGDVFPTNEFFTEEARIDEGATPVIAAGNNTEWDRARIKNGSTITQTDGTHRWKNYTSSSGLAIFNYHWPGWDTGTPEPDPSRLHMTGGTHFAERVVLGSSLYYDYEGNPNDIRGVGIIDVWSDGTFVVEPNTYDDPESDIYQVHHLFILDGGSKIDIRDNGELRVPTDMIATIDGYITADKIVAGNPGDSLVTYEDGDEYVVGIGMLGDFDDDGDVDGNDFLVWQQGFGTDYDANDLTEWQNNFGAPGGSVTAVAAAVPEPASALLALGWLAVARRQENRGI